MDTIWIVSILKIVVEEVDGDGDVKDHIDGFDGLAVRRDREKAGIPVRLD